MKVQDVISYLERVAPLAYQESYDNAGLIVGNRNEEVTGVLLCLDSTEAVVAEAVEKGCNLIIAHHPIVFKGLKRFNGNNYVERVVMNAIKSDVAIYAAHTNLDNVRHGVNGKIAEKLGLIDTTILAPKSSLKKLFTFVKPEGADIVRNALFNAGAGSFAAYDRLSYATLGVGTQNGTGGGQVKIEVVFDETLERKVVNALLSSHPESVVPYDIVKVHQNNADIGSGMIGDLPKAIGGKAFLNHLKEVMKADGIRYTDLGRKHIRKVALCGGAGGFLLNAAIRAGADIFITGDYKYHEFFDADGRIVIADIGHYESEQYTIELFEELLIDKFSNFAVLKTEINTNPINYL